MCNVSMIAHDWTQRHPQWIQPPFFQPFIDRRVPSRGDLQNLLQNQQPVSRKEFEELKAELQSLKKLLIAAKTYDEETGQKDCEDPDKIALFKQLAKLVDIDMSDVFPAK